MPTKWASRLNVAVGIVECPACKSKSFVTGEPVGTKDEKLEDSTVVVREPYLPTDFDCGACQLVLTGHAQLHVPGLGGQFTRTIYHDPVHYYGGDYPPEEEYNND